MYNKEAEILNDLVKNGGSVKYDAASPETMRAVYLARDRGYLIVYYGGITTITDEGRIALADYLQAQKNAYQRRAQQITDQERQRFEANARDRLNRRTNVICAIVGAIVGSVVTYTLDHIDVILALFKSAPE